MIKPESILFIRRDNIGDLILTTPAIRALRLKYPRARIGVLANSYNADCITNNPDVNGIYVYEKEKHASRRNRLGVFLINLGLLRKVRGTEYDVAIGCSYGYSRRVSRLAYLSGAKIRIGFAPSGKKTLYSHPVPEPEKTVHESSAMMELLRPLGVEGPPPDPVLIPDKEEVRKATLALGIKGGEKTVIFHISSRKPQNRWPAEKFLELGRMIQEKHGCKILLLWSPGDSLNPLHPGDDEKAEWLIQNMVKKPFFLRTERLKELIAVMTLGEAAVCLDGGAMHIAAALGKPLLAIWGSTDPERWKPIGAPSIILKKDIGLASSINAEEAFMAFSKLYPEVSGDR